MKDFIIFLKNLFNPYNFEYSLAFETNLNVIFKEKELSFIMYAKNSDEIEYNSNNDNYIFNIEDSTKKTSFLDKIKSLFNKSKALPDPDSYTMDDWINDQKNPVSRMISNIMESSTHAIQSILTKMQAKKTEKQNIPTTPSKNFEMSNKSTSEDKSVDNLIIPPAKEKPFVPLQNKTVVEEMSFDDSERDLETADDLSKNSLTDDLEKSANTEKKPSESIIGDINFETHDKDENDKNDGSR